MIAYNKEWLYSRHVLAQADEALHEQCIDQVTFNAISEKHPVKFYTPNFFIRIGLAILTAIILLFIAVLFLLAANFKSAGGVGVFIGILSIAVAEMFIHSKNHYNSGLDNMLVWAGGYSLWMGLMAILYEGYSHHDVLLGFIGVIIFLVLAVRYVDTICAIVATLFFLFFVYTAYKHFGTGWPMATIPFVMILVMGVLYFVSKRAMRSPGMLLFHNCWLWVSYVALVCFYAAGNYVVVDYFRDSLKTTPDISIRGPLLFGWFFWSWTFLIPVIYIVIGISKKEITLIRIGLPLLVIGILTFRNYHHVMEPETALMIGGTILFVISYSLISYLREPHGGFTFKPDTFNKEIPDMTKIIAAKLVGDVAPIDNKPQANNDWE